jgi:hypothetical protein
MVYIAVKKVKGRNYFFVVKCIRNSQGKPQQKIIKSLGSGEELLEKLGIKTNG